MGNLRRKLDFWKRIGTSSFIINVIEKGLFLTVRQFPGTSGFQKQQIVSLTCPVCRRGYSTLSRFSGVVLCNLRYHPLSVSVQANGKKRLIIGLSCVS